MNVPVLRINDPGPQIEPEKRIALIVMQINKELEKIRQQLEKIPASSNA